MARLGSVFAQVGGWRTVAFGTLGLVFALLLQTVLVYGLGEYGQGNVGIMNRVMRGQIDADILIAGSSRAMYHYDPRIIENVTGLTAFNIGRNGTKLHEQLHLLELYLARNNKRPAYLVQNVDITSLRENDDVTDPKQYVAWLNEEDVYAPLVKQKYYYAFYRRLPLLAMARTGGMQAAVLGLLYADVMRPDEHKGYSPQYLTWNEDFARFKAQNPSGLTWKLDPTKLQTLKEILELSRRNGIEVIVVSSPDYRETQDFFRNRKETLRAFREIADRFHVPFWDYSDDPQNDNRTYFYNSQHLNHNGAVVFSRSIGQRLAAYIARKRTPAAF